jgi:hypothetical protein
LIALNVVQKEIPSLFPDSALADEDCRKIVFASQAFASTAATKIC